MCFFLQLTGVLNVLATSGFFAHVNLLVIQILSSVPLLSFSSIRPPDRLWILSS